MRQRRTTRNENMLEREEGRFREEDGGHFHVIELVSGKMYPGVCANNPLLPGLSVSTKKKLIWRQTPTGIDPSEEREMESHQGACRMEVLYARCCGIDVHQRVVVACLSLVEAGLRRKEVRTFGSTTRELISMRNWLIEAGCTHVAM
jgi:hypothetical protein